MILDQPDDEATTSTSGGACSDEKPPHQPLSVGELRSVGMTDAELRSLLGLDDDEQLNDDIMGYPVGIDP